MRIGAEWGDAAHTHSAATPPPRVQLLIQGIGTPAGWVPDQTVSDARRRFTKHELQYDMQTATNHLSRAPTLFPEHRLPVRDALPHAVVPRRLVVDLPDAHCLGAGGR